MFDVILNTHLPVKQNLSAIVLISFCVIVVVNILQRVLCAKNICFS